MRYFFLFLCLLSFSVLSDPLQLSVKEAYQEISKGNVVLVDVRSEQEWLETGVATDAETITMHREGGIPAFEQELSELLKGDKTQPIALVCAGGVRSSRIQNYLNEQGYKTVYNVTEGMLGGWFSEGWIDQGFPLKKYKKQ